MLTKQELRSQKTKTDIIIAAKQLFASRGFDSVTMREIAKVAGCSHTTIYIYFKDKEALLHQLSMPYLESLHSQIEAISSQRNLSPEDKLRIISLEFIQFGLFHRNIYSTFMAVKSSRVDQVDTANDLNKMRLGIFHLLEQALQQCLVLEDNDQRILMYTRIYFYHLHGIITTYTHSEETVDSLLERLLPTFEIAIKALLLGIKQQLQGVN